MNNRKISNNDSIGGYYFESRYSDVAIFSYETLCFISEISFLSGSVVKTVERKLME
uniref:Uncharacterized protein n=1 Tax=Arundo donax TaxID=35708 RepID=A0A0A9F743_ARUDO